MRSALTETGRGGGGGAIGPINQPGTLGWEGLKRPAGPIINSVAEDVAELLPRTKGEVPLFVFGWGWGGGVVGGLSPLRLRMVEDSCLAFQNSLFLRRLHESDAGSFTAPPPSLQM